MKRDTLELRAIGKIIGAGRGLFRRVEWEDQQVEGLTVEDLRPFKKGQRFEAMITRDANTWAFVSMREVKPYDPPPITKEQSEELWNRIMTSASLPETTWD